MSVQFGEIRVGQIIENEYRIEVLERVLDWILSHDVGQVNLPSKEEGDRIRREALARLQKKYPGSKIGLKANCPTTSRGTHDSEELLCGCMN